jgi:hypothetical protein
MIAYNVSLLGKTADPGTLARPIAYVKTARRIERKGARTQRRKRGNPGFLCAFAPLRLCAFAPLRLCAFAFSSFS